ncbi:glycosyltransferase [Pedobacter planticolens]|nr:glycosyltransferase [Pedobacter planticolens]
MKRVLIISPHFPPANAADMQRIRMSLPYFKELEWEAEVVTVNENYVDMVKDSLLMESIPSHIIIHKVNAFSKKWTSKIGLGSLALRSLWFYRKKVNQLLRSKKIDLIYFSTTEFPVCVLGSYWKNKFNIPYVIDMQDPWHSDYYQNKPKSERPKKYWFSYRLHKFLEPIAMKNADGLISVSEKYINTLKDRYANLANVPTKVITFGANELDFKIAQTNNERLKLYYTTSTDQINLVYVGRGGYDMRDAIEILFKAFKIGLENEPELFENIHFHFIGTSYAPAGKGIATISPIAEATNISNYVTEYTNRIGFYESIKQLITADGLIIIGSNDSGYTASKLYPYILAKKQLLGIFNKESSAARIMTDCNAGDLITFNDTQNEAYQIVHRYITSIKKQLPIPTNFTAFELYTASSLTKSQVELFNEVLINK